MTNSAAVSAACFARSTKLADLHVPAYAIICICGMMAALWLSLRTAPLRGLDKEAIWDAGVFVICAAFVLSRILGFLLLLAVEHGRIGFSFADVLRFSPISDLSVVATAIVVVLWLRWNGLPLLRTMDVWTPCGALLWCALSLAEAASGGGAGLPTKTPWGIRIVGLGGARTHPVGVYGAAAALGICAASLTLLHRVRVSGRVAALAFVAAGFFAFLLDMLRVPEVSQALLDHTQWLALASILLGALLFTFAPTVEVH